jgi:succinyl-diaminopimelate desuccinylase
MNVVELLKYLINAKSETPDDGGLLAFIAEYLSDFEALRIDKAGVKNLFLYKQFGEGEHLCFAGHVDVVPAGEGWQSNPYRANEKEGFLYGRGAQDMKSGVAAFVQAMKETHSFEGTLSLLLTSDEEGEAKYGTLEVLKHLEAQNFLPTSCIVAEPTCEAVFGDTIKIGRRGSVNGRITVEGKQGHAAYPQKSINPIHQTASVLAEIAGVNLDEGDTYFAPSKFVITDIRSGMQVTNVTPGVLEMMFNVRNSTDTDIEDIRSFIAKHFKELKYSLTLDQSAAPFVTDTDAKIVRKLQTAVEEITGVVPSNSTAGGTSDARFIAAYGVDVIEFGVKNDTIHAVDERVETGEVEALYRVFQRVIQSY